MSEREQSLLKQLDLLNNSSGQPADAIEATNKALQSEMAKLNA
jgi:hypothetical protein